MKQATAAIHTIERTAQLIFWALLFGVVMLASMYIYMINKTVWNVLARQQAQTQIVSINSKLSAVEYKYISAKNSVTMQLAESMGFQPITNQSMFVTRDISTGKNVAVR